MESIQYFTNFNRQLLKAFWANLSQNKRQQKRNHLFIQISEYLQRNYAAENSIIFAFTSFVGAHYQDLEVGRCYPN